MALLEVKDLKVYYKTLRGCVKAVDSVSLNIEKGRALGIAGESGCGKTSMAMAILRLLPVNGKVYGGLVMLDGVDILSMDDEEFRESVRWKRISMISQGAMNALNPVHTVGEQIIEAILTHEDVTRSEAVRRGNDLLEMVGIHPGRSKDYPHEFSGGMKQRIVIAMALSCNPDIVIADEPTTALDVMVQSQILKAIGDLRNALDLSLMLITHDLSIIAQTCDDIAVMYGGKIIEYGSVVNVYGNPKHPYSIGLLKSFPNIKAEKAPIISMPGSPPDLLSPPAGCKFHPRCPLAKGICLEKEPGLAKVHPDNHRVACHNTDMLKKGTDIWNQ